MTTEFAHSIKDLWHCECWYKDGKLHREGKPAVISKFGFMAWCINGKEHREDGPAMIYPNGAERWYLEGVLQFEVDDYE